MKAPLWLIDGVFLATLVLVGLVLTLLVLAGAFVLGWLVRLLP